MALYFNKNKQKILLNGQKYHLNLTYKTITINNRLISSDNYFLIDLNGVYLTVKEDK